MAFKFNRAQRRTMKKLAQARGMHKFANDVDRICDGLEKRVFNKPLTPEEAWAEGTGSN